MGNKCTVLIGWSDPMLLKGKSIEERLREIRKALDTICAVLDRLENMKDIYVDKQSVIYIPGIDSSNEDFIFKVDSYSVNDTVCDASSFSASAERIMYQEIDIAA
jgi:hypothetical protein